ncbi:DUF5085 family protein [Neobacillus novalis]|uniref:DUF5085 family protein n=1 Tax=Neobacillus novalis TaxID=220687 RepID=A0AA95SAV7_9BACI|nr:DUF5085 family protein [Neobacillus novalis]WHY85844.1 DUF5085 family protein [Neobacillus novalis]
MNIKRKPVVFHNVISAIATCKSDEWFVSAVELRNAVIKSGLYGTGPVIYQFAGYNPKTDMADYTFYLPVSAPIELGENEKYQFFPEWKFEDGLVLRHADLEEDLEESYEVLRACADELHYELQEPFYHIYLDVYGGGIIDIYAPITKERLDD